MTRHILTYATVALLATACTNKGGESKEAQLDALRKEQASLEKKIEAIEKDLRSEGKATGAPEKVVTVSVQPVKTDAFNHYIEVQGKVDADQNVAVTPKVPGTLTSINVDRGSKVTKGQVLATIDAAALEQGLNEVQTQLDLANTVYEKQKRLWEQKVGTEIQYLQAKTNKESLERRLRTMREQIDMYKMRSPISGVVDAVNPKIGESVSPGNPMSAIRVVNFDNTKITAEVSEAYAAKIKAGDEVLVSIPDLGQEFKTKVRVVSKAIDPINRTFTVEAGLPGNMPMRPNMVAVLKINDYTNASALTLPVSLVQQDDAGAYVMVAANENGKHVARKRTVTTGKSYNGQIEVLSGLDKDARVISSGYLNLNEGQPVTYQEPVAQK